ncbi:ABC transporter E family member 2-like [Panicum miliaceum]|uniref:ABC transporter E family member 2-like n=1 Tax=Panicum miliaceum TaxID=4540 RepID=A0A3L6RW81_PANMI|nr:ABC transporter E family member 2-like [Panicum miliaceum]
MSGRLSRIAVVVEDRCRTNKCGQECRRRCPVNATGRQCIQVTPSSKVSLISEDLCGGCGICVKVCPFNAIQIINLPRELDKETTHRYGPNSFKLHRMPVPRPGQVLGLVGTNGIGKSTALKILAGKLKPNLGKFTDPPNWDDILRHFRGSELQKYFTRLLEDKMKAVIKYQYLDHIPKSVEGKVGDLLNKKDERQDKDTLRDILELKQRLKAAQVIRSLLHPKNYVIVVEHDLSILDYLSDYICCLYGTPGAYGVVTLPSSVREGINIFLNGFIPSENMRFREEKLTFRVTESAEQITEGETYQSYKYPTMVKTRPGFKLSVMKGSYNDSQIIVLLGENGTGKTTFIRMLAGRVKPDKVGDEEVDMPACTVSYKPQELISKISFTARELLQKKIPGSCSQTQFRSDVMKPLKIEELMDRQVANLSGGELQRVALCLCLGKPADIYLIDEPSAHLDSEQRFLAAKVIKRFILHEKKTAFVVEHDFIMATYLADKVVVFEGKPSVDCTANVPEPLTSGMNRFLSVKFRFPFPFYSAITSKTIEDYLNFLHLDVTFRTDPTTYRPRINKLGSTKDTEQKAAGCHYYLDY